MVVFEKIKAATRRGRIFPAVKKMAAYPNLE